MKVHVLGIGQFVAVCPNFLVRLYVQRYFLRGCKSMLTKFTIAKEYTTWQFLLQLNFVALFRGKLHETLPSVTPLEKNMSFNVFVAVIVAESGASLYFV